MCCDSPFDTILTDAGENFNNEKDDGLWEARKGIVLNELDELGNVTRTEKREKEREGDGEREREREREGGREEERGLTSQIRQIKQLSYLGLEMLAMASGLCLSRSVRTVGGGWLSLPTPTFSPMT